MDEFRQVEETVRAVAKSVVARHRSAGILTWALLHQLESEVLEEAAHSGEHSDIGLNMLRAPDVMKYPKDQREASFEGHGFVPIVFGEIVDAWNRVQ